MRDVNLIIETHRQCGVKLDKIVHNTFNRTDSSTMIGKLNEKKMFPNLENGVDA